MLFQYLDPLGTGTVTIGAEIITNTIVGFPFYNYSIRRSPKPQFELLGPLPHNPRTLQLGLGCMVFATANPSGSLIQKIELINFSLN